MGYAEAVEYLDALGVDAMKKLAPSTARIEALCDLLNHPEADVPAIHITGTNGKTSVARIVTSLLNAAGLSAATFTSPHLQSVRERIAHNGEPVPEDEFGEAFDHVRPYIGAVEAQTGETLSYFEVLTGMFFLWAASKPVDALVVEVGMGGRWDATNVLPASLPVITNIDLDHTALLGSDRAAIAAEKAGIIKPGSVLVTAERSPEMLELFARQAAEISALDRHFQVADDRVALGGRYLSITSSAGPYDEIFLPLHGAHQGTNAATALEAVTRFIPARVLAQDVVAEGMGAVRAPGRLETMRHDRISVPVVVDVAHNPAGMSAMINALTEAFAFDEAVFVLGMLHDKDHHGMLAEVARVGGKVIATEPRGGRAIPAGRLADIAQDLGMEAEVVSDVEAALFRAAEVVSDAGLLCVTGSHYVVGEARDVLLPSGLQIERAGEG